MSVQEGIGNVELIHWPIPISSNGEYRVNCAGLDHQGKGLTGINTGTLTETVNNPSGRVLLKVPITTLAPDGRGTSFQVQLAKRAANSISIVERQLLSAKHNTLIWESGIAG
jgi:hypothetical protein